MIKRTLEGHVKTHIKRYPSLYYGEFARIRALKHMLFHYGTGMKFLPDGSMIDVYDKDTTSWIKGKHEKWLEQKKEWQNEYDKNKNNPKFISILDYKELYVEMYESSGWYFEKFDPYADRYKSLRDGVNYTAKVDFITEKHWCEFSPVNSYPKNVKKDIVGGFIELINYMIETKQDVNWAKKKKKELQNISEK